MSGKKWSLAVALVSYLVFGMASLPAMAQVPGANAVVLGRASNAPAIAVMGEEDNDELLAGYIERQFGARVPGSDAAALTTQSSAGAALGGNEALLYDKLRPWVEQVAAGAVTSTKFSMSELDFDGPTSWTAAELGATALVGPDQEELDPVAEAAFYKKVDEVVDYGRVMNALLADCPYDLYWYDKTVGITLLYDMALWEDASGERLGMSDPVFTLAVAGAYADPDYEFDEWDEGVTYAVRPDVGAGVQTAVSNAVDVAQAHRDEPASERLRSYLQEICDYTSYNGAAARDALAYGDPWQLVWVFDGDASTTVVCEGYAKAFKYLCDLSGKDDVECLDATGTLYVSQGGRGEGHMWNVVRMPDDRNYLVDATNCDGDSMGSQERLFLAACNGGSYAEGYTFAANTAWGKARYVYDDDARSVFLEADLTISDTAYDVAFDGVAVHSHVWGAPTYAWSPDNGRVTATRVCTADATHVETETVSVASAVSMPATCAAEGERTYTSAEFKNPAFAVQTKTEAIERLAHVAANAVCEHEVAPTCEADGGYDEVVRCSLCGAELSRVARVLVALGHDYHESVVEATWDEQGYTSHACARCGDEYRTNVTKALKDRLVSLSGATVLVAKQTYTGKALKPKPTVVLGAKTLVAGVDYAVAYKDNVKAGTGTVVVTGKGGYTGTATASFAIAKAANGIKASVVKATQALSYKTSAQSLAASKVFRVSGASGALSFAKKSGNAGVSVTSSGKVTLKKGLAAGSYKCVFTVRAAGDANHAAATKSVTVTFRVAKAANPMAVKAVSRTASLAKVRKGAVVVARPLAFTKKAVGKLTYAKVAQGSSAALAINKSTGKVTVKKGTKKGTYTIKVKVTAAGSANYNKLSKTIACKVVVK